MKKNVILIFACLVFFLSCKKSSNTKKIELNNDIVLLLGPKKTETSLVIKNGAFVTMDIQDIIYTSLNDAREYEIPINKTFKAQIKTFKTDKPFIVLQHKYNSFDFEYFILRPGDTVKITYKNGKPIGEILNRKSLKYDLSFDKLNDAPPTHLNEVYFKYKDEWDDKKKDEYFLNSANYYQNLLLKLDSVYEKKELSKSYYDLRKMYITHLLNSLSAKSFLPIEENNLTKQDTIITYGFYRNKLIGRFNRKGHEGQHINYKKIFDLITINKGLSNSVEDFLLYYYIRQIGENNSLDDFQDYFEKFKEKVQDSSLISDIRNSYLTDFHKLKKDSEKVHLSSAIKKKTSLSEIIKENRGKVVFVDFWASWCAPCLKAIPDSKKLIQEYKDKEIVFLFISIDKNFKSWQKAMENLNLLFYKHSFLAINYPNADFFKELALKDIPRYLIFNKKGELMHKNAPSPSGDEIRESLNKYINEF